MLDRPFPSRTAAPSVATPNDPFIPDDIFPADIAIVFGITAWRRPSERAIELYRDGLTRRLLFTGGFNNAIQACEAEEMARAAVAAGVPEESIIVEPHATHTLANVTNARACIERVIGMANVRSVLLVAIHFHMRRVKAIAKRSFPDPVRIGCASYPSAYYTSADWFQSERGRTDVASEERKLSAYYRGQDGAQLR
jgi:uncharacterized SAM-binding protein YcdF (DUF218 family)